MNAKREAAKQKPEAIEPYELASERLAAFLREYYIEVLNVAGSHGSNEPGVVAFVKRTLEDAFYLKTEAMAP